MLRVQEIDKTIRGQADIPASFPAVKGTGSGGNIITSCSGSACFSLFFAPLYWSFCIPLVFVLFSFRVQKIACAAHGSAVLCCCIILSLTALNEALPVSKV